jgi:outer membrane autotransporter protein
VERDIVLKAITGLVRHSRRFFMTKHKLLASTALVAVTLLGSAAFSVSAHAADTVVDDTSDTGNTTDTTTVTKTGTDNFTVQTNTADTAVLHGTGTVVVGTGTITIQKLDADDASNVTVKINGDLTSGGNLAVTNLEATNSKDAAVLLTVTGTTAITGTTSVVTTGATGDGTLSTTVVFEGATTLTGAVTVDATNAVNANSDATITFSGATVNATTGITLNDGANAQAILNFAGSAAQTVTGTIIGAGAGEGFVNISDTDANAAASGVTFASNIGGTALNTIQIGSATAAGGAVFKGTVAATNITLDGGDNAAETATVEFQNAVTATTITLDKNTADATATFNATNGAMTIAGAINGGDAGDGAIAVIDDDASAAPDAVTFSGTIGGTKVGAITVGNSTQGGSAIFSANATVTADTVTVTGGDNALENSQVEFQHSLTATSVTLDDSTGSATAVFNMANGAQTISATVAGASAGEGTLSVYDGDAGASDLATFSAAVGGTSLKAINIGTSTMGGDASFASTAAATTITITAGDNAAGGENAGGVFIGKVTATTLALTGGTGNAGNDATAEFRGGLAATTVTLDDATGQAELTFNATDGVQAVSGTINGAASGEGKLIVIDDDAGAAADAVTFSGNVGATNSLLAVEIGTVAGAADAAAAVFNGTVAATTITLTAGNAANETALGTFDGAVTATNFKVIGGGDGTADATATVKGNLTAAVTLDDATGQAELALAGTSAQTVTGKIDAATAGEGKLNVTNTAGTVTFANAVGSANRLLNVTVASGATAVFDSTVDATGITIAGTATFDAKGQGSSNATLTVSNGAKIILGSNIVAGNTVFTVADVVSAGTTTVQLPTNFLAGTITLADSTADASADVANMTVTDTALVDYTIAANGNDIQVTAAQRSAASTASLLGTTTDAATAAGVAAGALASTDTAALNALTTAMITGGSEGKKAAEQLQPNINGAASQAVNAATRGATNAVSQRLNAARSGTQVAGLQQTGVASGDATLRSGGWVKTFGSIADQGDRDGIAGYDSHTYGVTFGMDHKVTDTVRVGGALSYAKTDVDGNDAGNSQTDVDSYQVAVYGSYEPGVYFVEGQLGYSFNNVDSTRELTFGGLNRTAKGSYDVDQYTASVAAGLPMKSDGFTITPKAGLFYSYSNGDSYTETGAGGLNLTVDTGSTSVLEGSLGGSVAYDYKVDGGMLRPEVRAAVLYDFIGDEASATSHFAGSGATFTTNGADVAQFGGTMGVGLGYTTADGVWEVRGDYDAELRSDYVAHTGMLTGRINF